MGTCCCSCLPLDQGSDLADHETETGAELELSSLVREKSQTRVRYAGLMCYHSKDLFFFSAQREVDAAFIRRVLPKFACSDCAKPLYE